MNEPLIPFELPDTGAVSRIHRRPLGPEWPVLRESYQIQVTGLNGEMVSPEAVAWTEIPGAVSATWYGVAAGPREKTCDIYWGSHGCHRTPGHRGHHHCDPCSHHPRWLHAVLYWSAHLFRRSDLVDRWWGGCVERWPYYGHHTRFYGDDAP
jgi:hypothetical protein